MLDTLRRMCHDCGRLLGVDYTLLGGDPRFVTSVGLRFESLSLVFRADPDDDTLAVSEGPLVPKADETRFCADHIHPWDSCRGLRICWAWSLTNQQGYTDGVRLEFSEPGQAPRAVVELVVAASAIGVFVAVASKC